MSSPARQPPRKEPVMSKNIQCYKAKPILRCSRTGMYIHARDKKCMSGFSHPQERFYEKNKAKRMTDINFKNGHHGKPTMPYKLHIQYNHTKNYVKHLDIKLYCTRMVNRINI